MEEPSFWRNTHLKYSAEARQSLALSEPLASDLHGESSRQPELPDMLGLLRDELDRRGLVMVGVPYVTATPPPDGGSYVDDFGVTLRVSVPVIPKRTTA